MLVKHLIPSVSISINISNLKQNLLSLNNYIKHYELMIFNYPLNIVIDPTS